MTQFNTQLMNSTNGLNITSLSVVIPVYKSAAFIKTVVIKVDSVISVLNIPFEIILVDDGSKDGSWEAIREVCGVNPNVKGICLGKNSGQHNALLCGIRAASHDFILTLDDDLQFSPEAISFLIPKISEDCDLVYGYSEYSNQKCSRSAITKIVKTVMKYAIGIKNASILSSLRLFRTGLRESFNDYRSSFVSIDILLAWATDRISAVQIHQQPRQHGKSNYNLLRLANYTFNVITGFTTVPLRIATVLGLLTMLFGIAILVFVLSRYFLFGTSVPGFTFIVSALALFSGVQLFSIGIIGEYLARMYHLILGKPAYVIVESVGVPFSANSKLRK